MGQHNGTLNGTANGTALEAPQHVPFSSPSDNRVQTRLYRCTHPKWDNQNAVPLKNLVTEGDLLNGTSTEDSREYDF